MGPGCGRLDSRRMASQVAAQRQDRQIALNCGRQVGKSSAVAVLASHTAVFDAESLILLIAPSQRQSRELAIKVSSFLGSIEPHEELEESQKLSITLARTKSRIVALPGHDPKTIRGFSSPRLIVVDEAAFVLDETYAALWPPKEPLLCPPCAISQNSSNGTTLKRSSTAIFVLRFSTMRPLDANSYYGITTPRHHHASADRAAHRYRARTQHNNCQNNIDIGRSTLCERRIYPSLGWILAKSRVCPQYDGRRDIAGRGDPL